MLFSSEIFFLFFIVYYLFHAIIPVRYRIYLIICGSTVFYASSNFYASLKVDYIWLPYLLTAVACGGVQWVKATNNKIARWIGMIVTIVILFLPLATFKYATFVSDVVLGLAFGVHHKILDLPLPLGVSFVTFTLTAYIVDTSRGRYPADQGPVTVLGYVLFFPHLIAGPILRPVELMPQLEHPRSRLSIRPKAAIAILTLGLVKKLVFADPIGGVVDAIYADMAPSGPAALLAMYAFSVQIYCDFSGYTDMAIGLAMLLGIRLPNNFRRPYAAVSLIDFGDAGISRCDFGSGTMSISLLEVIAVACCWK